MKLKNTERYIFVEFKNVFYDSKTKLINLKNVADYTKLAFSNKINLILIIESNLSEIEWRIIQLINPTYIINKKENQVYSPSGQTLPFNWMLEEYNEFLLKEIYLKFPSCNLIIFSNLINNKSVVITDKYETLKWKPNKSNSLQLMTVEEWSNDPASKKPYSLIILEFPNDTKQINEVLQILKTKDDLKFQIKPLPNEVNKVNILIYNNPDNLTNFYNNLIAFEKVDANLTMSIALTKDILPVFNLTKYSYAFANTKKEILDKAHYFVSDSTQNGLKEAVEDFIFRSKWDYERNAKENKYTIQKLRKKY
ncbi:hypothetical protein [Mycoplasmopsis gallinarum]|uniref:Uncharacterized protein n=1 Tax=Mycoplasmopsis gallinarum TaxID=29557 RepID=A0A168R7Q7_9BACT|nr:hypothetical protein [Mycoplasmopsis gallinarum]OAB48687.1 hypothetical protein MGALLINA_05740 [Mycoplasmopsis gallinarum]